MRKVGGPEIMACYFEVLPALAGEVAAIRADPTTPTGFASDDPRLAWGS